MPSWMRRILLLLACLGTLLVAQAASAQTLSVFRPLQRPGRENVAKLTNDKINRADCIENGVLQFNLTLTGATGYTVEVWEGTSCDVDDNRNNVAATCNQIVEGGSSTNQIEIKIQDLLARRMTSGGTPPTADAGADSDAGAAGAPGTTTDAGTPIDPVDPITGTADVCDTTESGIITLSLYFLLVQSNKAASSDTYDLTADLRGPDAPTNLELEVGEEALIINFTESMGNADDLAGYNIYCGTGCDSLMSGEPPAADQEPCGTSIKTSKEAQTDKVLTNGQAYSVAMSGRDTYGNAGPLSVSVCGTPQEVVGFYEAYRAAGGKGGDGGLCSLKGPARLGFGALTASAALVFAAAARRFRSGRRRK